MSTQMIDSAVYGYSWQQAANFGQASEASQQTRTQTQQSGASFRQTSLASQVRGQIESLLADIPRSIDNKLTFQDVIDYKSSQEKEWSERFKADMAAFEVNMTTSLSLRLDSSTGLIKANENHPDKAVVDQYFIDNPDMAEKFAKDVQLSKLTGIAERKLSPMELRQSLHAQNMAVWFESSLSNSFLLPSGGMVFGQAGTGYAGLDLRV
ncbi:hypothetical protein [Desulfonatronum sp. SC1]|uniref:hypothetical protein n=1 Tax=Desulfonatronum sp. SC1 TaxID=2109626 RepID=UPI000D30E808|nr:hypothetical protein [Desulfonatronum sp. SC1]PTN35582.1 hypothetical protein C6366_10810 [Desulfonatronum sp. SC1]